MSRRPSIDSEIRGDYKRVATETGNVVLSGSTTIASAVETSSGVSRRKPEGWIPPTSYSYTRSVRKKRTGHLRHEAWRANGQVQVDYTETGVVGRANDFDVMSRCFNPSSSQLIAELSRMENKALIQARTKMKAGDINLGVAFAERNETARLLAGTADRLVRSYRDLRRGRWREAAAHLGYRRTKRPNGSIPQQWLEYQYGWRPLLGDVHGAVDALTRHPSTNWIVSGVGVERQEIDVTRDESLGDRFYWPSTCTARGWYGAHVRIDAVPANDLVRAFADLGLTNPALVGWELVPFSFVVDWMLPVGSFLESLDAMLGYGPAWSSSSTFVKTSHRVTTLKGSYTRPSGTIRSGRCSGYDSGAYWEYVRLRRQARSGVPIPVFPPLKDPRSLNRMATSLSLMAQVFGGRRR